MSIITVSHQSVHYVLDAFGLTRAELAKKPKVKSVCANDKKHATIHSWGAWTSASITPSGSHMAIARGGFVGAAEVAIVDLETMTAPGEAWRRNLKGYVGAAFLDDEQLLLVEVVDDGLRLHVRAFDASAAGGLGEKVATIDTSGTELVAKWTTRAAKHTGSTLPLFLRIAPDGTWLAVSHQAARAWGGTLTREKKATWTLSNAFQLPLACSSAIRVGGAVADGRAIVELFDQRTQSAELAVIDVDAARVDVRRVDTARPLAFDADAAYATAHDGNAVIRYPHAGGAGTTIAAARPITNDVFVLAGRPYTLTPGHFHIVDIESDLSIHRKMPKVLEQLWVIQHLAFETRADPFTLERTRSVMRALGVQHDLAGWCLDQLHRASRFQLHALVELFHDGGLVGIWLEDWIHGHRHVQERRTGGKEVQFYAELLHRSEPSTPFTADDVVGALATLHAHGITMPEVFHDQRLHLGMSSYKRREPAAFTDEAHAILVGAWCAVAETGQHAIVAAKTVPTEAQILAAGPKLHDLLIGHLEGTATLTLKTARGDNNLEHFLACAFHVLERPAFGALLDALEATSWERGRAKQHVRWVKAELARG